MSAVYLLNTPVLTAYGEYRFTGPVSPEEAERRIGGRFISAIGHEAAARFLSRLLGREISTQRISVAMQPGDQALVLRLARRLPEGKTLTEEEMSEVVFELGWIERTG